MRLFLFAILASATALACDGKPLTGPAAQRAVALVKSEDIRFDFGPLFLVDGVPITSDRNLDPATIESVQVIKGTVATSTYGPKGSRGVVLIKTKRAR